MAAALTPVPFTRVAGRRARGRPARADPWLLASRGARRLSRPHHTTGHRQYIPRASLSAAPACNRTRGVWTRPSKFGRLQFKRDWSGHKTAGGVASRQKTPTDGSGQRIRTDSDRLVFSRRRADSARLVFPRPADQTAADCSTLDRWTNRAGLFVARQPGTGPRCEAAPLDPRVTRPLRATRGRILIGRSAILGTEAGHRPRAAAPGLNGGQPASVAGRRTRPARHRHRQMLLHPSPSHAQSGHRPAGSAPDSGVFHSLFHPLLERPRKSFQAEVKNDHGKKVNRVEAVTVDRRTRRRVDCPFCAKTADTGAPAAFYARVNQRRVRSEADLSTNVGGERPPAYANYLRAECRRPVGCDSVPPPRTREGRCSRKMPGGTSQTGSIPVR